MKTIFYTLLILVSFESCKSVEKMVEKGEYDKAFRYAISKLKGEKDKKTEYVKALEKAYFKLNSASLREVQKLSPEAKPENWSRVLNNYLMIEDRQNQIDALLPLISKDGYAATFDVKNYRDLILEAEENTCRYYYDNAVAWIDKSKKTGEKIFARDAYDEIKKIEKYRNNYRDSENLKESALKFGLTRVYFNIINDLGDFHSHNIEKELLAMPVSTLDNLWYDFSMGVEERKNADYIIAIELNDIQISPERERLNSYSESNEILIRKDKVKEKRDSVDVWVEKEVYEKVRADINEIYREKKSELHGRINVFETKTNEYAKAIPINVYFDFTGYGCRFIGDERALTDQSKKKMDSFLEPYPSDFDMAESLSTAFGNSILSETKKIKFE